MTIATKSNIPGRRVPSFSFAASTAAFSIVGPSNGLIAIGMSTSTTPGASIKVLIAGSPESGVRDV